MRHLKGQNRSVIVHSDYCPDLNICVALATFHFSGNTPIQSDSLNTKARGPKISSGGSLSVFAGILSGPDAFASFSPFSAVSIQCFVTDLKTNLADLSMTCRSCAGSSVDLSSVFR